MSTHHLVDPEILPILALFDPADITRETLPAVRVSAGERMAAVPPPALAPRRETVAGRGGAPDVTVLVYDPPSNHRSRPVFLHMHGGGMILGSAAMSTMSAPQIALDFDTVVVSVDYRLAPETPFPGPQEDNYAALDWVVANASTLGVDPTRIVVGGESAGGGLAAALAIMARDRGEFEVIGQVLTYPMLDHRVGGPDDPFSNPTTGEFVWTRAKNRFGWESLRGDYLLDDDRIGWYSPARAADLSGLPPTYIATGTLDLFFDENLDYARRLTAAGVPVEVHAYPGAFHAFNALPTTRLATQYRHDINGALRRFLAGT